MVCVLCVYVFCDDAAVSDIVSTFSTSIGCLDGRYWKLAVFCNSWCPQTATILSHIVYFPTRRVFVCIYVLCNAAVCDIVSTFLMPIGCRDVQAKSSHLQMVASPLTLASHQTRRPRRPPRIPVSLCKPCELH